VFRGDRPRGPNSGIETERRFRRQLAWEDAPESDAEFVAYWRGRHAPARITPAVAARPRAPLAIAAAVAVALVVVGAAGVLFLLPGPPVSVAIAPAAVTLTPTTTQQFAVTFRDARGRDVSAKPAWSTTGGLADAAGLYTAGTAAGEYKVVASLGDLTARAVVTVVPGPAAVLEVQPASIYLAPLAKQQVSAVARDQWGNVLAPSDLTWAIRPQTIGSVTSLGVFAAAPTRASGEVTIAVGGLEKTIPVTICPQTEGVGTLTFNITCSAAAYSYVESTISSSDAKSFVASVDEDVIRVQSDFGKTFADKPVLYLFNTAKTFTTGLQTIFGRSAATATKAGADLAAVYLLDKNAIAIDYAEARLQSVSITVRHELTHMLIHQIVGDRGEARLPIWANEGTAVVEEATAEPEWETMMRKYVAASMAATKTLPTLREMTSLVIWNSKSGDELEAEYIAAYEAVALLREDVSTSGELRLFDLMGLGRTFEQAYLEVSGRDFSAFEQSFADRVRRLAPSYPGIATAPDAPVGPGMSFVLYGFTPSSSVRVTITGGGYTATHTVTADAYGTYFNWLGTSWPAGRYTITAAGPNGTVKLEAVK
jgi:hypothetical protein